MNNKHVEILLVDDRPADIELTIHVLRQNQLVVCVKQNADYRACVGHA